MIRTTAQSGTQEKIKRAFKIPHWGHSEVGGKFGCDHLQQFVPSWCVCGLLHLNFVPSFSDSFIVYHHHVDLRGMEVPLTHGREL